MSDLSVAVPEAAVPEAGLPEAATRQPDDCSNARAVESAARELYQTATLLLGDGPAAMEVVEQTVATVEMDPCADGEAARSSAMRDLVVRSLARSAVSSPAGMDPAAANSLTGCMETDELGAAGITRQQLEGLLAGSGRVRMRQWLEGLLPLERSVFVMRAVLGYTRADTAALLDTATRAAWNESQVGAAYRSALCSLAASLASAAAQ